MTRNPRKTGWTRRELAKLVGALALPLGCERGDLERAGDPSPKPNPPPKANRPRFVVRILCGGGIDPLYTTDPKSRSDVASSVEIPYKPSEAGKLGPQFAALEPHLKSLTILNGVRLYTANHPYGWLSARMMKHHVTAGLPGALDIIGAHRDHQPIACMSLGPLHPVDYNTFYFGSPDAMSQRGGPGAAIDPTQKGFFDTLDGLGPAELEATRDVLASAARDVVGSDARARNTRDKIEQAQQYVSALTTVKRFKLETWSDKENQQLIARNFQRILWAMENDLAATYFLRVGILEWDTHFNNFVRQKMWNEAFAPMLARFLTELQARANAKGPLWDQVAVVASSEIGRHPEINAALGKDHFPECPYLFAGKCFQLGHQFGVTGKKMEAHGIALSTGAAHDGSQPPDLTDLGTTLLHMVGLDPSDYAFHGRSIDFLRAV